MFSIFKHFVLLLLLLTLYVVRICYGFNYCSYGARNLLCQERIHIVCNPRSLTSDGELIMHVPMQKVKHELLRINNAFRNKIASGNYITANGKKYAMAKSMRELIWDNEFAYIAKIHSSRCTIEPDLCHSTLHVRNVTQLTAVLPKGNGKTLAIILSVFETWFDETTKLANGIRVGNAKYTADMNKNAQHVLTVLNDRTSRMGCAVAYCEHLDNYVYHLTCHYENMNKFQFDIYVATNDAQDCTIYDTVRSAKYPFLCKNTGKIFAEYYNGKT